MNNDYVLGEALPEGPLQPLLRDGVRLCTLINILHPGICPAPAQSGGPFKQMENISSYLKASTVFGVPTGDSFQTITLYENQYFPAVLNNIFSLARIAQQKGFTGPTLGPKLATETPRTFNEQQLREAATAPRLLGGVGSQLSAIKEAAEPVFSSTKTVLHGLTLEAKVDTLQSKLDDVQRRIDLMELKQQMKGTGCSCNCSVM